MENKFRIVYNNGKMTGIMVNENGEWKKQNIPLKESDETALKKLWTKIMRFKTLIKGDDKLIYKAIKNNLNFEDFDASNFAYMMIYSMYQSFKENFEEAAMKNGMDKQAAEQEATQKALASTADAIVELSDTLKLFIRRVL